MFLFLWKCNSFDELSQSCLPTIRTYDMIANTLVTGSTKSSQPSSLQSKTNILSKKHRQRDHIFGTSNITTMKLNLLLLLLLSTSVLAEDGLRFQYVQPEYHEGLERLMGADYIKRCFKRENPPETGDRCRRLPKSCFWGEQRCGDGVLQPTTRCNCLDREWTCSDYSCPTIGAQCPSQDPDTISPSPICSSHLTCFYEQERCCDTVYAPKW